MMKRRWMLASAIGLLAAASASGVAGPREGVDSVRERLETKIAAIPYVDTHVHLPDPRPFRESLKDVKYDVTRLLGQSTYVSEFTSGSTWDEVKANLAGNAQHPYYRVIREAFVDLYGLAPGAELTDESQRTVSERMDAAHRDPGWYDEVLRKRMNVTHLIWLGGGRRGSEMPAAYYHPVWNIDGFVFVTGREEKAKGKPWTLDELAKRFDVKLARLSDLEKLIADEVDAFFAGGGVALKSTAAYYRTLDFDDTVPRERADRAFAKVVRHEAPAPAEQKALEDWLMTRVLTSLAKLKKPIQFHTGNQQNWNTVSNSNPLGLNRLLVTGKWWDVKFVVLHGGYPYTREAITMTRYFGNCYLDLAWMVLFSPAAATSALAEAIDLLPGNQLTIGTDTANLEEMYGTVKFTRRVLAGVLAEKVAGGYLTEEVALAVARRVLHDNAMALYGLTD
jgi:predicted TIM-barrel fold metal-dependent hydrolase